MMKAINIEGSIVAYANTPKSWKNVIGNFDTLSGEDLESFGFYDLFTPEYNPKTHSIGDILWQEDFNRYEYALVALADSISIEEAKTDKENELRSNLYNKLKETDWYVTRKYERSVEIPQHISELRAGYIASYEDKGQDLININEVNEVLTFNTEI